MGKVRGGTVNAHGSKDKAWIDGTNNEAKFRISQKGRNFTLDTQDTFPTTALNIFVQVLGQMREPRTGTHVGNAFANAQKSQVDGTVLVSRSLVMAIVGMMVFLGCPRPN